MILPRLYALRRCGMKRFCVLLLVFLGGAERVETFDRDPGWEGVNNRVVPKAYPTVAQDFGYNAGTNHAGDARGEMGGVVTRASRPAYYGDKVGPLTLDQKLGASGTFAFTKTSGGAGVFVGFFQAQQPGA